MIPISVTIHLNISEGTEVPVLAALLVAMDVLEEEGLATSTAPMYLQYELGVRFPRATWSEDQPWRF